MATTTREYWHALYLSLRGRIYSAREDAKADSLFVVMLDLQLTVIDDDVRTLIEAIEDAESGSAKSPKE